MAHCRSNKSSVDPLSSMLTIGAPLALISKYSSDLYLILSFYILSMFGSIVLSDVSLCSNRLAYTSVLYLSYKACLFRLDESRSNGSSKPPHCPFGVPLPPLLLAAAAVVLGGVLLAELCCKLIVCTWRARSRLRLLVTTVIARCSSGAESVKVC